MERAEDKTILVVDDEPDVRNYLKTVLLDAGFKVLTAADGEEALRVIRDQKPDFISLDLILPKKSGHKLLYELRKDKALSRIPVLIVTAHAKTEMGRGPLEELLESGMMSGPGAYLEKPVNPMTYVRAVKRALHIEETEAAEDKVSLKDELQTRLQGASPDALRRALEALAKE
ncbi:MAG: response regulator [Candidatus Sumerlaeota bacterium]|nr:response regulator [Candidatus Sumerlaeota bacterium]